MARSRRRDGRCRVGFLLAFGLVVPLACGGRSLPGNHETETGDSGRGGGGASSAGSRAVPPAGAPSGGTGVVASGGQASSGGQGGTTGTWGGSAGQPSTDPCGLGAHPTPPAPLEFAATKNQFGFALSDSFILMPCLEVQAHDCLTELGTCPNQDAARFEERGRVFSEEFLVGGCPNRVYSVTIQVNGVVEGKYYQHGVRRSGNDFSDTHDPTGADGWYVGGSPIESGYNVYKLTVLEPDGKTEVEHYYLNAFPLASGLESHQTVLLGYEAVIDVPGQGVVRLSSHDSNCRTINNCGFGDTFNLGCPAPRLVPNEPGLAVPETYGGQSVDDMNIVNGAQQPFHAQMVHLTVTNISAKP